MKTSYKLSLIAATLAVISNSAAFADNQPLKDHLALQRQATQRDHTTVAVFARERRVKPAEPAAAQTTAPARFERRTNAHGETFGVWVDRK
jgi:hypothetical protein